MTEEIVLIKDSGLTLEFLVRDKSPGDVVQAKFMVKYRMSDPDADALLVKTVALAASPDGVISTAADGNGDDRPLVRIAIAPTDTTPLNEGLRLFAALKLWPVGGASPYSPHGARRGVRVAPAGVATTT